MRTLMGVGAATILVVGIAAPLAGPVAAGGDASPAAVSAAPARPAQPFDFDGDGYPDLVIEVVLEGIGSKSGAGAVQVLYGSAAGPTARDQFWHQNRGGVKDRAERDDMFGAATASGDFDADGYADLAIGVPGEDIKGRQDTGAVAVLYGGRRGLTARDQLWHQNSRGVPGRNETSDQFGAFLAVGDFQGDGYPDLAIGSPGERTAGVPDPGRIVVLRGSARGLRAAGGQSIVTPLSKPMAVGDFNADGRDDLATFSRPWDAADDTLVTLLGTPAGLSAAAGQRIEWSAFGLDRLWGGGGLSGSAGDLNGDGRDDIAMTSLSPVPGIDVLAVLYAGPGGFSATAAQTWHVHTDGVLRQIAADEAPVREHGCAMWSGPVLGDLTGDGIADLVIREGTAIHDPDDYDPALPAGCGEVDVLVGGPGGVVLSSTSVAPDPDARLDSVLPKGVAGPAWLVVDRPAETVGSAEGAGAVTLFQGTPGGVAGAPSARWTQDSPGIRDRAEPGDAFGAGGEMYGW